MKLKHYGLLMMIVCAMLIPAACSSGEESPVVPTTSAETTQSADSVLPEDILKAYMAALKDQDYETMYGYVSENATMTKDDFLTRNKNIYEGIEASNIEITIDQNNEGNTVSYQTTMDTQAGPVSFSNTAEFNEYDGVYKLEWNSNIIFPNLNDDDKVRVKTTKGERGSILDRNGNLLVGKGEVWSVYIVPGKLNEQTRDSDIEKIAEALSMTVDAVNAKLSQKWVKDDLMVPLDKEIPKSDEETEAMLLTVPGVGLDTVENRVYPLGEKAAALTGYIHNINQEELDAHPGEGYTAQSKIGKVGMESLLESRLRGSDGCKIYIEDINGNVKQVLAEIEAHNGEDVTLTIDAALQAKLYDQMKDDKGTAVVMNPGTGEILALVSTPSYDPNSFIMGLSEETWAQYNDEETQPMLNRFKAAYVPGSSFKPITAAIGLSCGAFAADEDFGSSGTTWTKDNWNNYSISTLQQYSGAANVQNALIYSDNIYFAKAALKIGRSAFADGLKSIGFGEDVPFEFGLKNSTFGTDLVMDSEIECANSGFGQGNVLINPIHMASIYSAFTNGGDMMTPYLENDKSPAVWKEDVFTDEAVQAVRSAMVQVIENPDGTGHSFKIEGLTAAGKTGTAEIKSSKEDEEGTELGWFVAYPVEDSGDKPYLVVAMVEDVKGRGGSHYVIPIARALFAD